MKSYYNPTKIINTNSFTELMDEKEWCAAYKAKLIAENREVPKELEQHMNSINAYMQTAK